MRSVLSHRELEEISREIKKNVASDILAPSADATHLHIARVRIPRSVLSHGKFGGISYEIRKLRLKTVQYYNSSAENGTIIKRKEQIWRT